MMAVKDAYAYVDGSIVQWIAQVESPNSVSPMLPALASILFVIGGVIPFYGIFVSFLCLLGTVAATYGIARVSGDKGIAVVSAVLVASAPVLVIYSRSFHFALPATATTTLALFCLVRSRQAEKWLWTLAFGMFVGLMPLARTMTLAFVPCMSVAALFYALAAPDRRWSRFLRLVAAGVVACLTAASWLAFNGIYVANYLLSFGYGARATEYGPKLAFIDSIMLEIYLLLQDVYLPHFLILVAGLVASAILLVRAVRDKRGWGTLMASPLLPLSVFATLSFLALATSQNKGTAFSAPIVPAMLIVATWSILRVSGAGFLRLSSIGALCVVSLLAFAPMVDLGTSIARPTWWNAGSLGRIAVTSGASTQQIYERANGINRSAGEGPLSPEIAQEWKALNAQILDLASPYVEKSRALAFGFRNAAFNVNTLGLVNSLRDQPPLILAQIEPTVLGDDVDNQAAWLTSGTAGPACVLLTSPGVEGDFRPYVNSETIEAAARKRGFAVVHTLPMPNGRELRFWARSC
ncbi:glycosyltransferase family 39 protein [Ancylobacter sp. MQZ15Z-1]|uniref:Glycosyltransferase family 39 protein n=1 Tax=Ancylobacter mangrovi TaxID=2972472 RepID=A0A9X2PCY1_9HYPH|nr:glycosyltransferase family 39 protein [Ancylobacter mangrovi]MCS0496422.1 glycosyltransferase family 39 protein [Ancylobacter mangrovi]